MELEAQRLSLLDRVGQLAVGLQQEANVSIWGPPKTKPHQGATPQEGWCTANACPLWAGASVLEHASCRQLTVSRFQFLHLSEMATVPGCATPGAAEARSMGLSTETGATHLLAQVTQFLLIIKTELSGLPNEGGINQHSR